MTEIIRPVLRTPVEKLVALLSRGLLDDGDADELFDLLRAALQASSVWLGQELLFAAWHRSSGMPPAWGEIHTRYRHQDPSISLLTAAPPGTWYQLGAEPEAIARETDLYASFVDVGFRDMAACRVYSPFVDDLFFCVFRERDQPAFSGVDRALLALLYPHIAAALAAKRALAAIGERPAPLRPDAFVHLSFPNGVVHWNERARRFWRARLGPIAHHGWKRIERAIQLAARRFTEADVGGRSQRLLGEMRVELANVPACPGEVRRVLVLFVDDPIPPEDNEPATPMEALLSPTQLAIARAIAGGQSASAIAAARSISVETVRSHARAIYARLEVSRAELAEVVRPLRRPRR